MDTEAANKALRGAVRKMTMRPQEGHLDILWHHAEEPQETLSRARLRRAAEPMTTRDIALQLLIERVLDKSDQRLLRLMTKRVGVALRGQRENGVVRCDQGPGQYML